MEKVLAGRDVLKLAIDRTPLQTKATTKQPVQRTYYRAQYAGITFTVQQAFIDAMDAKSVGQVVLNMNTEEIDNPLKPGEKITKDRISFGSFAFRDELLEAAKFEREIQAIDHPELNAVTLSDEHLAALQKLIAAPTA